MTQTVQTHADVSNVPMKVTREREACLLGSAILAAVGGGLFRDIPAATEAMVHVVGTVVSKQASQRETPEQQHNFCGRRAYLLDKNVYLTLIIWRPKMVVLGYTNLLVFRVGVRNARRAAENNAEESS